MLSVKQRPCLTEQTTHSCKQNLRNSCRRRELAWRFIKIRRSDSFTAPGNASVAFIVWLQVSCKLCRCVLAVQLFSLSQVTSWLLTLYRWSHHSKARIIYDVLG